MSKWKIRIEKLDLANNVLYQGQHEVTNEMIVESKIGEEEMLSIAFQQAMHRLKLLIKQHDNEIHNK